MYIPNRIKYLLLFDLTLYPCPQGGSVSGRNAAEGGPNKIVEIGVIKVFSPNAILGGIVEEKSIIINVGQVDTSFVTRTQITQNAIDNGLSLREGLQIFVKLQDSQTLLCSWDYETRNRLEREVSSFGLPFNESHLNIAKYVTSILELPIETQIKDILKRLKLRYSIFNVRNIWSIINKISP